MGNSYYSSGVKATKAPIPALQVKEARAEFSQLKKEIGWENEDQYIFMNRQIMYCGERDEIIVNYDNFVQQNILGGQNEDISIPLGIYNHYLDYFNNTILEALKQLTHTNPYNDDFPLQKKCSDGINEWLLLAYMNCRSCKVNETYSVRFMFQVAVYSRIDKKAQERLAQIAKEQLMQQEFVANPSDEVEYDAKEKEVAAYKVQIPQALTDDELTSFQQKFTVYIAEFGWKKEEIFILMERQVLHTGTHDDIVPKYVDFFEKVVFGDKSSDHSMPVCVYDHYLSALSNTIENSLGQVADEEINEYKDTFKLQQKVDDGEREWLLIAVLCCNIATKPNKRKFYVRYATQVAVYSRMDVRIKQLQKNKQIVQSQIEIEKQVKTSQNEENQGQEGSGEATKYIDVVDYEAIGVNKDDDKKENNNKPEPKQKEDVQEVENNSENTADDDTLRDDMWQMDENYSLWSTDDVVMWINVLNDDFGEKYGDIFGEHEISGADFEKLKSEHYLISTLLMNAEDARKLAPIVSNRIEQRTKLLAKAKEQWPCDSCSMMNDVDEETCKICSNKRVIS